MQEKVSRVLSRPPRYEDAKKVWWTKRIERQTRKTSTDFCGAIEVWYRPCIVRDVIQDGAGCKERERFVLEDHNNTFSCVAATGLIGFLRGSHEGKQKTQPRTECASKKELIAGLLIDGSLGEVMPSGSLGMVHTPQDRPLNAWQPSEGKLSS